MVPSRSVLRSLGGLCLATAAFAQAIVEYAAKSAAGAGAASGAGSDFAIGACRVDSSLIPCLRHLYPMTFQVLILVVCIFVGSAVMLRNRRA